MDTVAVYRFEIYNRVSRSFERQAELATQIAIAGLGGVVMHATRREVPASEVSGGGVWSPVSSAHASAVP